MVACAVYVGILFQKVIFQPVLLAEHHYIHDAELHTFKGSGAV